MGYLKEIEAEMLSYYPSLTKREDFDDFWKLTKEEAYKIELNPELVLYDYPGNSGSPADFMHWIMMGVAVISVDCRGQNGDTGNHAKYSSGSTQSVVCQGISDKIEKESKVPMGHPPMLLII